jgi:hypothetical protein
MTMSKQVIKIENARIGFRNFTGAAQKFNPVGKRNFCVFFETDFAETLEQDGWNVRWLQPKNPDDERQGYLQVAVEFANVPPKVVLVTKKNKTILNDETINMLDYAEIENVDLVITPYHYDFNGKSGVKAYLKTMFVTIREYDFADKYEDVPFA